LIQAGVERTKHTCLRLELSGADTIYGKCTWHHSHFVISFTDGSPLGFAMGLTEMKRPRRSGGASGAGTNRSTVSLMFLRDVNRSAPHFLFPLIFC
ncbi:hypothetical protein HID58_067654, partial [Brassica napus]